jgi:hypothetical protein
MMRRRDSLKQVTVAAGLAGLLRLLQPVKASESSPPKPFGQVSGSGGAAREGNCSAEYLGRVQEDRLLAKPTWDMEAQTVDLVVASVKKQDITSIARYGIQEISAPAGILVARLQRGQVDRDLHLQEGKPVEVHLKIGRQSPLDWVNRVA